MPRWAPHDSDIFRVLRSIHYRVHRYLHRATAPWRYSTIHQEHRPPLQTVANFLPGHDHLRVQLVRVSDYFDGSGQPRYRRPVERRPRIVAANAADSFGDGLLLAACQSHAQAGHAWQGIVVPSTLNHSPDGPKHSRKETTHSWYNGQYAGPAPRCRVCFRGSAILDQPKLFHAGSRTMHDTSRDSSGHVPEAGAVCGTSARTDLCGGWQVTAIPTATGCTDGYP